MQGPRLGFSKPSSYFGYWSKVNAAAHQHLSNAFWTLKTIPYSAKRYILQYRGGVLYNEKLAVRYGRQSHGPCPMCHLPDSAGHTLGGCVHKHAKGMIIKRHNQATWEVYNSISAGDKGNIFTIIDAGIEDQQDNDEEPHDSVDALQKHQDSHEVLDCCDDLDGHKGARIPEWMLPDVEIDLRSKLRPDILRVNGLPFDNVRPPQSPSERGSLQIEIVEVGYFPGTRWEAKLEEKELQHAQLVTLLKEAGWKVAEPRILLFGVGGTLFQQTNHTLQQLGVTRKAAHACLLKIHTYSALWADKLVKLRRHHTNNNAYNIRVT